MATSQATILIDGKALDPYSVLLEQRFDSHHRFTIAISSEKVEGNYSTSIDNSISNIGAEVEIQIERPGGPGLVFKGIVTSIHIDRSYTADSLIIFEGISPTYLAEDGRGMRSFEEMKLSDLAETILGDYPSNLFNPDVNPQYGEVIPYVVQYRETNYEFLQRMAALYGEWFFYDGQAIIFGKLPSPDTVELTLGDNLSAFNYGVNILPTKFKYQSYNYAENRTVETSTAGFKPGWMDNYAQKGYDAAEQIFPGEPLDKVYHEAQDDAVLKHLAEAKKSSMLSDSSFFRGESQHPGISVGGRIGVHALNRIGAASQKSFVGRYRVISVTHHLDPNKDYHNSFEAIPLSVTAPPVIPQIPRPAAETQVAVVVENDDPDKMGRIRVRFKWQVDGEMTPWIRIMTNHAFGDRGIYFVPEIDDEVLIGFEQGNPDRPYMKGAHYHGNAAPEWADPDNNLKAIKTRSGHTILLDDTDGSEKITILDKSNNTIVLNTKDKSISISAPDSITLSSTDITLKASDTIKLIANDSNSLEINKKGEAKLTTTKTVDVSSTNKTVISSKAIEIKGSQTVLVDGKQKVDVKSTTAVEVNGTAKVDVKAVQTSVEGSAKAELKGAMVDVNGSGPVNVKGMPVKMN